MSAADLAADAPAANDAAPAAPTVLVVEDEASLAEVLCDNLRDEGFAVLHAADGRAPGAKTAPTWWCST